MRALRTIGVVIFLLGLLLRLNEKPMDTGENLMKLGIFLWVLAVIIQWIMRRTG